MRLERCCQIRACLTGSSENAKQQVILGLQINATCRITCKDGNSRCSQVPIGDQQNKIYCQRSLMSGVTTWQADRSTDPLNFWRCNTCSLTPRPSKYGRAPLADEHTTSASVCNSALGCCRYCCTVMAPPLKRRTRYCVSVCATCTHVIISIILLFLSDSTSSAD
jgi:hypothetical protein